jgi:hypothetical protein
LSKYLTTVGIEVVLMIQCERALKGNSAKFSYPPHNAYSHWEFIAPPYDISHSMRAPLEPPPVGVRWGSVISAGKMQAMMEATISKSSQYDVPPNSSAAMPPFIRKAA